MKEFPNIGRSVLEVKGSSIKEIIFQGYRIIYRILNDFIEIIAIIHGSRQLQI